MREAHGSRPYSTVELAHIRSREVSYSAVTNILPHTPCLPARVGYYTKGFVLAPQCWHVSQFMYPYSRASTLTNYGWVRHCSTISTKFTPASSDRNGRPPSTQDPFFWGNAAGYTPLGQLYASRTCEHEHTTNKCYSGPNNCIANWYVGQIQNTRRPPTERRNVGI